MCDLFAYEGHLASYVSQLIMGLTLLRCWPMSLTMAVSDGAALNRENEFLGSFHP